MKKVITLNEYEVTDLVEARRILGKFEETPFTCASGFEIWPWQINT